MIGLGFCLTSGGCQTESAPPDTATPTCWPGSNIRWRRMVSAMRESMVPATIVGGGDRLALPHLRRIPDQISAARHRHADVLARLEHAMAADGFGDAGEHGASHYCRGGDRAWLLPHAGGCQTESAPPDTATPTCWPGSNMR